MNDYHIYKKFQKIVLENKYPELTDDLRQLLRYALIYKEDLHDLEMKLLADVVNKGD